ncbi:hypothetical protein [Acinetobacter sp. ANC 3791]|uniref:hypothetical protein n=1 Tax=Acinetobacter sp. ANC 3791 TaxID=2529836 RepID=UPI00103FDF43|nr:hypothetical protein [Acinetobacter sp. ANC 3791]TCB81375.1 hypothetical protein E0H90_14945 [Acinetobacter sp. ANC 3791]
MFSQSFILLIVLCIGWMGVANASVQSMHWEMLMQSDMSSMPQHTMSEHCHQPSMPMKMSNDCQDQVSSSQHQQHLNCPDCQIMHCQSVNADLPQATSILTEQSSTDVATTQYWTDHRTNLAGYWQEILRPPKA